MFPLIQPLLGAIDGSNQVFDTPAPYVPGSVRVFINGQLKTKDLVDGWTELGGTKVRLKEPPQVLSGYADVVQAYYIPL